MIKKIIGKSFNFITLPFFLIFLGGYFLAIVESMDDSPIEIIKKTISVYIRS